MTHRDGFPQSFGQRISARRAWRGGRGAPRAAGDVHKHWAARKPPSTRFGEAARAIFMGHYQRSLVLGISRSAVRFARFGTEKAAISLTIP